MELSRKITALLLFACLLGSGSVALSSQAAAGGIGVPRPAKIDDVICLTGCLKLRETTPGGSVQITGVGMKRVSVVSFAGPEKKRIRQKPSTRTSGRLVVAVPTGAQTGRVIAHGSGGVKSDPSPKDLVIGSRDEIGGAEDRLRVVDASVTPRKAFRFGRKKPTLNFVVNGGEAEYDLRFDLIDSKGTVASSIYRKAVPTKSNRSVTWNGLGANGKPVKNGQYRFIVRAANGTRAELDTRLRKRSGRDPFTTSIYGYIFPVRGPHEYWDGIGAGRGHQGLDIGAKCGTKVVAARGGEVSHKAFQKGGAGHYVVIKVAGTGGQSHVYMHLRKKSPVKKDQFVHTGQKIGTIGLTGRTTACHLHFELWSKPGWYQGGTFLDPTRRMKYWDSYS